MNLILDRHNQNSIQIISYLCELQEHKPDSLQVPLYLSNQTQTDDVFNNGWTSDDYVEEEKPNIRPVQIEHHSKVKLI